MEIIIILIIVSFSLAGCGVVACLWAERNGQFRDLESPAQQILIDDD